MRVYNDDVGDVNPYGSGFPNSRRSASRLLVAPVSNYSSA